MPIIDAKIFEVEPYLNSAFRVICKFFPDYAPPRVANKVYKYGKISKIVMEQGR